jgi:hypothetical protein
MQSYGMRRTIGQRENLAYRATKVFRIGNRKRLASNDGKNQLATDAGAVRCTERSADTQIPLDGTSFSTIFYPPVVEICLSKSLRFKFRYLA